MIANGPDCGITVSPWMRGRLQAAPRRRNAKRPPFGGRVDCLRAKDGRRQAGHHWLKRGVMQMIVADESDELVPAEEASGTNPRPALPGRGGTVMCRLTC